MSATIKYKGNTIASITTDSSKTLKTSGKYCEGDIVVENVQDGGITPSGNKAITATTSTQTGIDVTNYATASVAAITKELLASLDTDFVAENIKKDVDLFGLLGTLEGGGDFNVSAFYGASKATSGQFTVASDTRGIDIYHELGVPPKLFAVYPSEDSLASISQATDKRYTAGGMFISSKFVNEAPKYESFYGTDIIVAQINISNPSSTVGYSAVYASGAIGATGRTSVYEIGSTQYNPLYSNSGTGGSFTASRSGSVNKQILFEPYASSFAAYLLGGTTWNWIAVG